MADRVAAIAAGRFEAEHGRVCPPSALIARLSGPLPLSPWPPLPLRFEGLGRRTLRRWRRLVLGLCGLLPILAPAAVAGGGPHPLALMAGLLPLQLAGLLWAVARS